jgi:predicted nucleic acid-binding protein
MTSEERRLVADTHALIWHLVRSPRLSETARSLMRSADRGDSELVVPTVVMMEALWISERKNPGVTFDRVVQYISQMPNATVAVLDLPALLEAQRLPQFLEMHDRIIAATARVYGATLISRDRQLQAVVETVW